MHGRHEFVRRCVLEQETGLKADYLAGHSLGEYSALVAARAIQYYDAVALVHSRGSFMLQAGIEKPGTMAAAVGLDAKVLEDICIEASEK